MFDRRRSQQEARNSSSEVPSLSRTTSRRAERRDQSTRTASNQQLQRQLRERGVQPKLTVNEPGDEYEKEADRVAAAVMQMPDPTVAARTQEEVGSEQVQRMCPRCQGRYREGKPLNCEECEGELQRRTGGEGPVASESVKQAAAVASRPGKPLSVSTKSFFETRMGRDLSDVRVHTGPKADRAAQAINAEAFTLGKDVVFRSRAYRPASREGKQLLAHELTHVVQQTGVAESEVDGKVMRRVHSSMVDCTLGEDGVPSSVNVESELEAADTEALVLSWNMASRLESGEASDAYETHFGLPPSRNGRFLNRLTGQLHDSQMEAERSEMRILARRFGLVFDLFNEPVRYECTTTVCDCNEDDACTFPGSAGQGRLGGTIYLCPSFWSNASNLGDLLIHEALHMIREPVTDSDQPPPPPPGPGRNFHIAQCYHALVADVFGTPGPGASCPQPPGATMHFEPSEVE